MGLMERSNRDVKADTLPVRTGRKDRPYVRASFNINVNVSVILYSALLHSASSALV